MEVSFQLALALHIKQNAGFSVLMLHQFQWLDITNLGNA